MKPLKNSAGSDELTNSGDTEDSPVDDRSQQSRLIAEFVASNPDYYAQRFALIGAKTGFVWTFNWAAALLGPIWFGMRNLWKWGLPFVMLEVFSYVQIARGWFGDLGAEALGRVAQIEGTLNFRKQQLAAAIEKQADNVAVFERAIVSLEQAITDIQAEAVAAQAAGTSIALTGMVTLFIVKLAQGVIANPALEKRYFNWLSDRSISSGLSGFRTWSSVGFVFLILLVSVVHYAFPGKFTLLTEFPTTDAIPYYLRYSLGTR